MNARLFEILEKMEKKYGFLSHGIIERELKMDGNQLIEAYRKEQAEREVLTACQEVPCE